ncbi:MAG: CDP-diacylglycerol--serine O-phosphatidyltransferase [Deltaproteobacteria bacterium]|nr:CDP-diacylglycerol--serine O-phosphatidyltransferase [Deltaproteobacteria bacterium]
MKLESSVVWHRRKFLVPNAVTLGNLFCGFLACIYAGSNRYEKAAVAIGIAILLDGLDGRLARRLNATSKFGVEFDSFSDFISFGVAPAYLLYCWCFRELADEFGVTVTFVYCLACAARLARFNISESSTSNFEGLPTPGAAFAIASFVFFSPHVQPSLALVVFYSLFALALAYLMVSKVEYFSVKRVKFDDVNKFVMLGIGATIALTWYSNKVGFMALATFYCLSGPVGQILRKRKDNRLKNVA